VRWVLQFVVDISTQIGVNIYTMNSPLTDRQALILNYLREHCLREDCPPSMAEIARAFGLASVNGVAKHLQALAEKGYIELIAHKARGIRLLEPAQSRQDELFRVPLIGRVAAGLPIWVDAHVEREIVVDRGLFRPSPSYLLRVRGDSMIDAGILDGDLIGVHATPNAEHGQIVVARLGHAAMTVKRLHRVGAALRLLSCNANYAPIDPDPTDGFAIEGLYCGLIRTL